MTPLPRAGSCALTEAMARTCHRFSAHVPMMSADADTGDISNHSAPPPTLHLPRTVPSPAGQDLAGVSNSLHRSPPTLPTGRHHQRGRSASHCAPPRSPTGHYLCQDMRPSGSGPSDRCPVFLMVSPALPPSPLHEKLIIKKVLVGILSRELRR